MLAWWGYKSASSCHIYDQWSVRLCKTDHVTFSTGGAVKMFYTVWNAEVQVPTYIPAIYLVLLRGSVGIYLLFTLTSFCSATLLTRNRATSSSMINSYQLDVIKQ